MYSLTEASRLPGCTLTAAELATLQSQPCPALQVGSDDDDDDDDDDVDDDDTMMTSRCIIR
jgi:hypothetical protein